MTCSPFICFGRSWQIRTADQRIKSPWVFLFLDVDWHSWD